MTTSVTLLRCGCAWHGEIVHYCRTRRAPIYQDVEKVWPGSTPWVCRCVHPFTKRRLLRAHRHVDPWGCVPEEEIEAWRAVSGCNPHIAREMYWLEREFGRLEDRR
jgi:hypothetical protein